MYKRIEKARDLPTEWNRLCEKNIYMQKSFLEYMEKVNYCNQSYHLFYKDNRLYSCFMMFEKKFNLLIFTDKFKLNTNMKFIYLPLSVTASSIILDDDKSEVESVLNKIKGTKIIINTNENDNLKNFHRGHYLPICLVENRWKTFDEYMESLRAGYRRRHNQALKKGKDIKISILEDNRYFSNDMYELYEQVYNHSTYSLEKLSKEFFWNDFSKIITFTINENVEGFVQLIEDRINDTLIFEFVGYNYENAHKYDLYQNMLLEILKYAITNNFRYINLGQTAYDAKLKFGGKMYYDYFLLSNSNKILNWLIGKNMKLIQYKVKEYNFNVFKESKNESDVGKTKAT